MTVVGEAATQDTTHLMNLAPVVQTLGSAIHQINLYPADSVIDFRNTIRWIVIYPVDSAIQRLNNRGQDGRKFILKIRDRLRSSFCMKLAFSGNCTNTFNLIPF